MPRVQEPWPPSVPTAALPYDQRGCCFPWGPCGPIERVQLRYTLIGGREVGALHNDWGRLKTGQLFLVDVPNTGFWLARYQGSVSPEPVGDQLILRSDTEDQTAWVVTASVVITLGPDVYAIGEAIADTVWCTDGFAIPVTEVVGPAPQPEFLFVKPRRWYDPSAYPYLGP